MTKTNVMRLLDQAEIAYHSKEYEFDEKHPTGFHVPGEGSIPEEQVFKTLVTRSSRGGYFVFCIPINAELDLKKAAGACGEKKIEMLPLKDLLAVTGYLRGGCSPIGMKKKYPTYIDETAILFDTIGISGGQRGVQLLLSPISLSEYICAKFTDLTF